MNTTASGKTNNIDEAQVEFISFQISKIETMIVKKQHGREIKFDWHNDPMQGSVMMISGGAIELFFDKNDKIRKMIFSSSFGNKESSEKYYYNASEGLIMVKETHSKSEQKIFFFKNNNFMIGATASWNYEKFKYDKQTAKVIEHTSEVESRCKHFLKRAQGMPQSLLLIARNDF